MTEEHSVFVGRPSGLVRELGPIDISISLIVTPEASGILYYVISLFMVVMI